MAKRKHYKSIEFDLDTKNFQEKETQGRNIDRRLSHPAHKADLGTDELT